MFCFTITQVSRLAGEPDYQNKCNFAANMRFVAIHALFGRFSSNIKRFLWSRVDRKIVLLSSSRSLLPQVINSGRTYSAIEKFEGNLCQQLKGCQYLSTLVGHSRRVAINAICGLKAFSSLGNPFCLTKSWNCGWNSRKGTSFSLRIPYPIIMSGSFEWADLSKSLIIGWVKR